MSRFDEPIKMKLGEILKTFTTSTYAMDTGVQCAMADASPIWDLLGLTEEEYYVRYPPVDVSGNEVVTGPTGPTGPVDTIGFTEITGPTGR